MKRITPNDKRFWVDETGCHWRSIGNSAWFTNLDINKNHAVLDLQNHYDPGHYQKYDNYDAIEVSKVSDIPCDYPGVMGVPITFLYKHNPRQFDIIGFRKGNDGKDLSINGTCPYYRILIRNRNVNTRP